jgi:hypothetical protein
MKRRIGSPKYHKRPATMKKRAPRETSEATTKTGRLRPVTPLAMVKIL